MPRPGPTHERFLRVVSGRNSRARTPTAFLPVPRQALIHLTASIRPLSRNPGRCRALTMHILPNPSALSTKRDVLTHPHTPRTQARRDQPPQTVLVVHPAEAYPTLFLVGVQLAKWRRFLLIFHDSFLIVRGVLCNLAGRIGRERRSTLGDGRRREGRLDSVRVRVVVGASGERSPAVDRAQGREGRHRV